MYTSVYANTSTIYIPSTIYITHPTMSSNSRPLDDDMHIHMHPDSHPLGELVEEHPTISSNSHPLDELVEEDDVLPPRLGQVP